MKPENKCKPLFWIVADHVWLFDQSYSIHCRNNLTAITKDMIFEEFL